MSYSKMKGFYQLHICSLHFVFLIYIHIRRTSDRREVSYRWILWLTRGVELCLCYAFVMAVGLYIYALCSWWLMFSVCCKWIHVVLLW